MSFHIDLMGSFARLDVHTVTFERPMVANVELSDGTVPSLARMRAVGHTER